MKITMMKIIMMKIIDGENGHAVFRIPNGDSNGNANKLEVFLTFCSHNLMKSQIDVHIQVTLRRRPTKSDGIFQILQIVLGRITKLLNSVNTTNHIDSYVSRGI